MRREAHTMGLAWDDGRRRLMALVALAVAVAVMVVTLAMSGVGAIGSHQAAGDDAVTEAGASWSRVVVVESLGRSWS